MIITGSLHVSSGYETGYSVSIIHRLGSNFTSVRVKSFTLELGDGNFEFRLKTEQRGDS